MNRWKTLLIISCIAFLIASPSIAKVVQYDLTIDYKKMDFTGRDVSAMSINNSIPGPTLRFREGDMAKIRVHNKMDVATSVHWHGLLLPHRQDGVPYVSNPPIEPGKTFEFKFPIKQTGTYWYHSHTGLQEQRGVYGAIVITPKVGKRLSVDRDEVVVLSDWTDENPDDVLRTLKRGSDFYSLKKGTMQSLYGAATKGALTNVFKRSLGRMPPMDISDVAYDRCLANGKPEMIIPALPGEKVRLRFINAATATYYSLQFAGGPVQIIAADGKDVQPVEMDSFLMAIAETYDLLVAVPKGGAYEFRATAQDGSGHTSIFIGSGKRVKAPDIPKPNLYKMRMPMGSKKMKGMDNKHDMKTMKGMKISSDRPMPPYSQLRSINPTTLPVDNPVREVVLNLTGDMERYIWSINGEVISEDNVIRIRHGENVRFVLVNQTMMHHPMHLHGHFFRVINKHGDHSPLKHTVDVPPLSTQIIEFEGNEYNDWFFHCHILYHAKAGMARVVSYEDSEMDIDMKDIRPKLYKDSWFTWVDGTVQSHMTDGVAILSNSKNIFSAEWEVGWQNVKGADYDIELAYDRYFSRLLTVFVGGNFTSDFERGIIGVRYLLPLNFDSELRVDTKGKFRVTIGQSLQLTNKLEIFGNFEYDTESDTEWVAGARYTLSKNLFLVGQFHSDFGAGGGIRFWF
ncbi:MAG: multicopper oxidase domain-containing protein [Nitrospinales bacterium]